MVAQIVESRGYCVLEAKRSLWTCGRCRTVQDVKRWGGRGANRTQLDCWLALRDRWDWHMTEAYGLVCAECCAIVAPWALDAGRASATPDGWRSTVKGEVARSRLRGGQVTAAKLAAQRKPVAQPAANERTRGVKR